MARTKTQLKYPWDQWFKKKRFQLTEGDDFKCMPHSMLIQIRNAATSRGMSVSIKVKSGRKNVITVEVKKAA